MADCQWYVHVYEQCSILFQGSHHQHPSWVIHIIDSRLIIRHTAQVPLKWDTIVEDRTLNSPGFAVPALPVAALTASRRRYAWAGTEALEVSVNSCSSHWCRGVKSYCERPSTLLHSISYLIFHCLSYFCKRSHHFRFGSCIKNSILMTGELNWELPWIAETCFTKVSYFCFSRAL